jgi:hypothetical protein
LKAGEKFRLQGAYGCTDIYVVKRETSSLSTYGTAPKERSNKPSMLRQYAASEDQANVQFVARSDYAPNAVHADCDNLLIAALMP